MTSSLPTSLNDTVWLYLPVSYVKGAAAAHVRINGLIDQGATGTGVGKAKCASLATADLPSMTQAIVIANGL